MRWDLVHEAGEVRGEGGHRGRRVAVLQLRVLLERRCDNGSESEGGGLFGLVRGGSGGKGSRGRGGRRGRGDGGSEARRVGGVEDASALLLSQLEVALRFGGDLRSGRAGRNGGSRRRREGQRGSVLLPLSGGVDSLRRCRLVLGALGGGALDGESEGSTAAREADRRGGRVLLLKQFLLALASGRSRSGGLR